MDGQRFIIYTDTKEDALQHQWELKNPNRRGHSRHRVGVFTEISRFGHGTLPGITYNMSRTGALILTSIKVERGDRVQLNFVSQDNEREVVDGIVIHTASLQRSSLWAQKVGVKFMGEAPSFFEREIKVRD